MGVKDFWFKTSKQRASAAIFLTVAWVHGPDNNAIIINSMITETSSWSITDLSIQLALNVISCDSSVSMAPIAHVKYISTYVLNNIEQWNKMCDGMTVSDSLCVGIILGLNIQGLIQIRTTNS